MQLSNQLNLKYETYTVSTQVQILTDNFSHAIDSCAPFVVKLMKRPPARYITEAIKIEINEKYILSQSSMILPNCRRKQNTNNKKWSFVS